MGNKFLKQAFIHPIGRTINLWPCGVNIPISHFCPSLPEGL
jgi:hypothetical protein